jgi:hypothetical protein
MSMVGAHPDVAESVLVRRLIEHLGGRYGTEMGIDVDAGADEIERWFLAATLFGSRISAAIAVRTARVLSQAGIRTVRDIPSIGESALVRLLDAGGYARYDERTAARLHALARVVGERYGGSIAPLGARVVVPTALEAELRDLPGWGPTTIRMFLRELRGVWPGAQPALDERTLEAAAHLGFLHAHDTPEALPALRALARHAGVDFRDLEVALSRLALRHGRRRQPCPGRSQCSVLG